MVGYPVSSRRIATLSDLDQYGYIYGGYTRGTFIDERVYAVTSGAVCSAEVADIQGTLETLLID